MSSLYQPDDSAFADSIDSIRLLSQRDLSLQVPINFVPVAAVSLSAACFTNGRFEAVAASKCVSNLLAIGFRRFALDVYWDGSRKLWNFCPVQLGSVNGTTSSITGTAISSETTSVSSVAKTQLSNRDAVVASTTPAPEMRQATNSSLISSYSSLVTSQSLLGTPSSTTSLNQTSIDAGDDLIEAGMYTCSTSLNLLLFMNILTSYLDQTDNNLNATTVYITLDLKAASLPANSTNAVPNAQVQPDGSQSLGQIVSANTSNYLYTPVNLSQQREDLNASGNWYSVPQNDAPDPAYFDIENYGGHFSTPNGWPSESFITFTKTKRLLVSFGAIGSQMNEYNFTADAATIFPPGFLQQAPQVSSACFFNAKTTDLASVNSSWAVAETTNSASQLALAEAKTLSGCGFTPVLNDTLQNSTAAQNPFAYHDFVMNTIWSWDRDEPLNSTQESSRSSYRCAALNATSGFWRSEDCTRGHFGACREGGLPYDWQIGYTSAGYDRVDQACSTNSIFTVPRTALENSYLLDKWRSTRVANSVDDELLWLNFNDLDVETCWVIGQNSTCPYQEPDDTSDRTIIVPTVASVIVFVLTILTIFVKCAANRRSSKRRRRRGDDGWDYEGVPA